MGAFDGFKCLPRPVYVRDDSARNYVKNQSAFCFFKGFEQKDLEKLYEDAVREDDDTVWVPNERPNQGRIGLSTWYVKALLENLNKGTNHGR